MAYKPKVKICGNFRKEDIKIINKERPDYCGFIIEYGPSFRSLEKSEAMNLARGLDGGIGKVAVFVNKPFMEVADFMHKSDFDAVQLHGDEDEEYIDILKSKIPDREVWKAFKIGSDASKQEAYELMCAAGKSLADMVLFDAGFGEGKAFNHDLIKDFKRPFILAGGITVKNMTIAMESLHPYMLDVSSGVEREGFKDAEKINDFIYIARSGIGGRK